MWLLIAIIWNIRAHMFGSSMILQPLESFNFKSLDKWPQWRRCFPQFCDASSLGRDGQQKQVYTLLHCIGESAADTLTLSDIWEDDCKSFAKFARFFKIHKNVNCCLQQEGEGQTNSSLACICWSKTATMVPCRTRWCMTALLSVSVMQAGVTCNKLL